MVTAPVESSTDTGGTMVAQLWTPDRVSKLPRDHRDAFSIKERVRAHSEVTQTHQAARAGGHVRADDYGVYLVSGLRRQGKTLFGTSIGKTYFEDGRLLFTNLGVTIGYRISALDLYLLAKKVPRKAVVIVDEIHLLLSRYSQNSRRERELISALAGVGKREVLFIGITQQEEMLSHDFMRELDGLIYVRARQRPAPIYPPWAWIDVATLGPRPLERGTIADKYNWRLSRVASAWREFKPNPAAIYEAGKHVYSWADVPFGRATGNTISAGEMRGAVGAAENVVFEYDAEDFGEEDEAAKEIARQWQERAQSWITLLVNTFMERDKQGRRLRDSSYSVANLVAMVNEMWAGYMHERGILPFQDAECLALSKRLLNAQGGIVRLRKLTDDYESIRRIYEPEPEPEHDDD